MARAKRQDQVDIAKSYRVVGKLVQPDGTGLDTLTSIKYMRPEGILLRAINRLTCRLYAETLSGGGPGNKALADWSEFMGFRDAIKILTKAAEAITLDMRRDLGDWRSE